MAIDPFRLKRKEYDDQRAEDNRKFGIRLARLAGEKIRPPNASSTANSWINHAANSSSSAFASFRSRVSKPSVNQP